MAPSVVGESLKGAELVAEVMQADLGYPCNPPRRSPSSSSLPSSSDIDVLSAGAGPSCLDSSPSERGVGRTDIIQAVRLGSRKKVRSPYV